MVEYNVGPRAPTLIEVVHCSKCGTLNRAPEFLAGSEKAQLSCHGCFANSEVMRTDTFLKPIHYYWAVNCKQCSFVIALAATPNRPDIERARNTPQGFSAFCPACKAELEYQPADVLVWAGPPPTPAFIAHPAFAKLRTP
jgi:hypothetical protein